MSVLEFKKPEKTEPHLSGPAKCAGCQHEWAAVAPVGITQLTCPACNQLKGFFKLPATANYCWTCGCGGILFQLTPDGALCIGCGCTTAYSRL